MTHPMRSERQHPWLAALLADQRRRWHGGERVPVEAYLKQQPALQADSAGVLDLIYNEVVLRERQGETPLLQEYVQRFPHLAGPLRDQFELHGALEGGDLFATRSAESPLPGPDRSPTSHAEPPDIPGYEILGELGRGGMGIVYKARQVKLKRLVALKMIHTSGQSGSQELTRFRIEAEAIARLQHPHIVQIYEVGEFNGHPFLSLEFVDGGSLAQRLDGEPKDCRKAARLVQVLARAMHSAHERGIIHRDLKPANVLLTAQGDVKVTDFGLAKRLDARTVSPTGDGTVLGTPGYMAPEQADCRLEDIGPATDVYALGAMLYEMLTGRPPFRGENALATILQVRSGEPVAPSVLRPDVPRDLEAICLRCLAKAPRQRYPRADALAHDLARFLAGEPVQARPTPAWERCLKWTRRHPAFASLSALTVLITVLSLALIAWQWRRAESKARLAAEAHHQAQLLAANLAFDHGLAQCRQGDASRGILWLARCLEIAPADAAGLQQACRLNLAAWRPHVATLHACLEQGDSIGAVAWSPDRRTVVVGSDDGIVRFWDSTTGQPVGPPLAHGGPVKAVAFSPDGQLLLSGSADCKACLWDLTRVRASGTAEPRHTWNHPDEVLAVAFSPDGQTILTGCQDHRARLWRISGDWRRDRFPHPDAVVGVAFQPDGEQFVTVCANGTGRLWPTTGPVRSAASPVFHHRPILAVAFSPDGKKVLLGSRDRTTRVCEATSGKAVGEAITHPSPVHAVALSADGERILTGCGDGMARVWEASTGRPVGLPVAHPDAMRAVSFCPDGQRILTAGRDAKARVWEVATGLPAGPGAGTALTLPSNGLHAVFRPDGQHVVAGCAGGVAQLWDRVSGKSLVTVRHEARVAAVAFSPDGQTLLTGSLDKTARLWHAATGQAQGQPLYHPRGVDSAAFRPDGQAIATGCADNRAYLWNLTTRTAISLPHQGRVRSVAFNPDGQTVLTGSWDRTARLWHAGTGEPIGKPLAHPSGVWAVAFSLDGRTILTGSADRMARLWDAATGAPVGSPLEHQGTVCSVAFSPDGQMLLTGSTDHTARLWQTVTGKPVGPPLSHDEAVWSVAFSPDGRTVLTVAATRVQFASLPLAVEGSGERLARWAEVLTGMELDAQGSLRVLDAATWQQRQQRLAELGGAPVP